MGGVVVVGAGQAGARAAISLRETGWGGAILVVGDEPLHPYERPPLSKDVLLGRAEGGQAHVAPVEMYARHDIRLELNTKVSRIVPEIHAVETADGRSIEYSDLVIATGARARELTVPGHDFKGVYRLRDVADAKALRAALPEAKHVVIVGGGFIGLEVAAAAHTLGVAVTVLERGPACLARVLPQEAANVIASLHAGKGVKIRCAAEVLALEGDGGQVNGVRLADGSLLDADIVVVGIGSVANDELAREAGIDCLNGILVDAVCRTSAGHVYAIGDVASRLDGTRTRGLRLESWQNAERQGVLVAATIMDTEPAPDAVPWFWTDQFDTNIQMLGGSGGYDSLLVRQGTSARQLIHFYLQDRMLTSAVLFNSGRERRSVEKLIGKRIVPAALADPAFSLRQTEYLTARRYLPRA